MAIGFFINIGMGPSRVQLLLEGELYEGLYRGFRDMGYYPFYFHGYGILCSIFLCTFRDIDI